MRTSLLAAAFLGAWWTPVALAHHHSTGVLVLASKALTRGFLAIAVALVTFAGCAGCSHERFDEWLGPKIGLPEGVCKDGELELLPPRCEPHENLHGKTTMTSGG